MVETVYDIEDEEDNQLKMELYSLDKDVMDIYSRENRKHHNDYRRSKKKQKRVKSHYSISPQQMITIESMH